MQHLLFNIKKTDKTKPKSKQLFHFGHPITPFIPPWRPPWRRRVSRESNPSRRDNQASVWAACRFHSRPKQLLTRPSLTLSQTLTLSHSCGSRTTDRRAPRHADGCSSRRNVRSCRQQRDAEAGPRDPRRRIVVFAVHLSALAEPGPRVPVAATGFRRAGPLLAPAGTGALLSRRGQPGHQADGDDDEEL